MDAILLVFIFIPVVVVMILVAVRKHERARTESLAAVASEVGMTFLPEGHEAVQQSIQALRLFNRGHGRKFINMMVGESDDVRTAVFGYRYRTGAGQSQSTHIQTVFSFESSTLDLPAFELRPENLFHKIGQAMGYQDFDFSKHPEFSKRFVLRGADESAVRRLFSPEVIGFFEGMNGVSVEAEGNRLIFYRARKRLKPEEFKSFMDEGFRIYGLFRS